MLRVREMNEKDKREVLPMALEFYDSDAVDHKVSEDILARTFQDAVGVEPSLQGYMLCEGEEVVGFAYLTTCYACEIGGKVMIVEEVFMKDQCRGKGYGKQFFNWMFENHPDIKRFRLEVTSENDGAIALYKKLGFDYLNYGQMIHDRK